MPLSAQDAAELDAFATAERFAVLCGEQDWLVPGAPGEPPQHANHPHLCSLEEAEALARADTGRSKMAVFYHRPILIPERLVEETQERVRRGWSVR